MRIGRRMLALGLTSVAVLTLGIGIASARTFPRADPSRLSPGIREQGLYTQVIAGTYGKLWPLPGLVPGKGGLSAASYGSAGASCTSPSTELVPAGPLASKSGPVLTVRPSTPSNKSASMVDGLPMANVSATGGGSDRVGDLENSLRSISQKLNSN